MNLILKKDNKIIYESDKSGLRPLVECLRIISVTDCHLYDKVIGLAAAKLIQNSKIINNITTDVISKPALNYLTIKTQYKLLVDNILNNEKKSICPMEKKAIELSTPGFLNDINNIFT